MNLKYLVKRYSKTMDKFYKEAIKQNPNAIQFIEKFGLNVS